jgi:UTP--glucose-1-phosphate uridylyltransferase
VRVRKAVLPAAGFGTRFLPATKAIAKEVLPLVDRPIIQYAVEEAIASGIEQIIIVISSSRSAIEDHFDSNPNLERWLEERGDIEMLRQVRRISEFGHIAYVHQKEQLGLGHAVLMAKELVGHEPFAVILSDDVVQSERSCIGQLIEAYQHTGGSALAVMEVPREETDRYGIVDIDPDWHDADVRLNRIRGMVEKPQSDPPSNKAIIGRYVLTPKIFEKLEQTQAGAGGEIQLTDAIEALMEEQEVFSYAFEGTRHDAGTTMGWLKASVQLALDRDDFGGELRAYLAGIDLQ